MEAKAERSQQVHCEDCGEDHHQSSFCACGKCFFQGKRSRPGEGTSMDFDVVKCSCGTVSIWD